MLTETDGYEPVDLFIIGGGINGCGIARDAAGRGLSVHLAEQGDLAQGTSSASTKLFHGGLRYLEYFEVRLVRESLQEREVLLKAMPHISWPMRFVLPLHDGMRFDSQTPASRWLTAFMPWMKGRRPNWVIRFGLFLYDHIGGRELLPPTRTLDLTVEPAGNALRDRYTKAFEYSDCWVQDSRLVVLNARDSAARGAQISTRRRVVQARRVGALWEIDTVGENGPARHYAKALVNAAGPWIDKVIQGPLSARVSNNVRLVRGSHIVTKRLYEHDRCYTFQGSDGRIVFAIPYEQDFTLIGTTDVDHEGDPSDVFCTEAEQDYLCAFVSEYFSRPVTRDDVVWAYAGVRPLHNDGSGSATAATRDYVLSLEHDQVGDAPLLNVFGGKITTYRRLAEHALDKLAPTFPFADGAWTEGARLPGGDFSVLETTKQIDRVLARYTFLDPSWATRLFRTYGTEVYDLLGDAKAITDLGQSFGGTLTEAELRWLVQKEFARSAEDVLWRRTRLGLKINAEAVEKIESAIISEVRKLP